MGLNNLNVFRMLHWAIFALLSLLLNVLVAAETCNTQILDELGESTPQLLTLPTTTSSFTIYGWVKNIADSVTPTEIFSINDPSLTAASQVLDLKYESSTSALTYAGFSKPQIYTKVYQWFFFLLEASAADTLTSFFALPSEQRDVYIQNAAVASPVVLTITPNTYITFATTSSATLSRLRFISSAAIASAGYSSAYAFLFEDYKNPLLYLQLSKPTSTTTSSSSDQTAIDEVNSIPYSLSSYIDSAKTINNYASFDSDGNGLFLNNTASQSASFLVPQIQLEDPFSLSFYMKMPSQSQSDVSVVSLFPTGTNTNQVIASLRLSILQNTMKIAVKSTSVFLGLKIQSGFWYYVKLSYSSSFAMSTSNYRSIVAISYTQDISNASSLFSQLVYFKNSFDVDTTTFDVILGYFINSSQIFGFNGWIQNLKLESGGHIMNVPSSIKSICPSILASCKLFALGDASQMTGGTQCIFCDSGKLKVAGVSGNSCAYAACPDGMYQSSTTHACQPCHENCATCFAGDNESCTTCASNFYSYEYTCYPQKCPNGFYLKDATTRTCQKCSASCLTCSGPSSNECLTCISGTYNNSGVCTACDQKCKQCTDLGTCQSCNDSYVLVSGRNCMSSCGTGYFINDYNQCEACQLDNCVQCSDQVHCIKCSSGYYLDLNTGYCTLCDSDCVTCFGSSNTECTSCIGSRYLLVSSCLTDVTCKAISGKYANSSTRACEDCQGKCASCSSDKQCNSCISGYYFKYNQCFPCPSLCSECVSDTECTKCPPSYFLVLATATCARSCPTGSFGNTTTNTCDDCSAGCIECSGSSNVDCDSCAIGYYFVARSLSSSTGSGSCIACNSNCQTCTSQFQCTTCKSRRYSLVADGMSRCVEQCGDFYYADDSDLSCKPCRAGCMTCSSSASNCPTCVNGYYNSDGTTCLKCIDRCAMCDQIGYCTKCAEGYMLQSNTCVRTCSSGYPDSTNRICHACHPSCSACSGPLITQCSKCNESNGFYLDTSSNMCRRCHRSCSKCTSESKCSSCTGGYLLLDTSCLTDCPVGTLSDGSACVACVALNCAACDSVSTCSICADGYYLDVTSQCQKCDSTCKTCSGAGSTSCTSCDYNTKKLMLSTTMQCVTSCPASSYRDPSLNQCLPCHYSCTSCTGSSVTQCTTCRSPGFYLTYPNTCKQCDSSCNSCTGPGFDSCTTCSNGYLLLGDSVCVKTCPDRFFKSSSTCAMCNQICKTCTGSDKSNCLTCADGYYMSVSNQENIICSACNAKCRTCDGAFSSNCLTCNEGYVQYKSTCEKKCPTGLQAVNGVCTQCPDYCGACVTSGTNSSYKCTQCLKGYYFDFATNTCLFACGARTYVSYVAPSSDTLSGNSCLSCDDGCSACSSSSSNCTSCIDGYIYHSLSNRCVAGSTCLSGYISSVNTSTGKEFCAVCRENCLSCISKLYYFEGKCSEKCPTGSQVTYGSNICVVNIIPEIILLTDLTTLSFREDLAIVMRVYSPIAITSMKWTLSSPTPVSTAGKKFLEGLNLTDTSTLYIPLANVLTQTIYSILFSVSNSKGSASTTVTLNSYLMLKTGSLTCTPSTAISSGFTQFQVRVLNFAHSKTLSFDYLLAPQVASSSHQSINGVVNAQSSVWDQSQAFIIKLNSEKKSLNMTTFQIRASAPVNVKVSVHNGYVDEDFLTKVDMTFGSSFNYNTTVIENDITHFESQITLMIANLNANSKLSAIAQDIRVIRTIITPLLNSIYSFAAETNYFQQSFEQAFSIDVACKIETCKNGGKCVESSRTCDCTENYKGPRCLLQAKHITLLKAYLTNLFVVINAKLAKNLLDEMLINVLLDISFFRDLLDPLVFPSYFALFKALIESYLIPNPTYTATVSSSTISIDQTPSKIFSNRHLAYFANSVNGFLFPMLSTSTSATTTTYLSYIEMLDNYNEIAMYTILNYQNIPIENNREFVKYNSVGVITSAMYSSIVAAANTVSKGSTAETATTSSARSRRVLASSSSSMTATDSSNASGIVGYEFGSGLDILKALFNFPVFLYSSNRHIIYVPLSVLREESTFRISITEVFNLAEIVPPTSAVLTAGTLFTTGFFKVEFSQNQTKYALADADQPFTIFMRKTLSFPSLNTTNDQLDAYECLHYDVEQDEFENLSCAFQRENSTHFACSCYNAPSYISVAIITENVESIPDYNTVILANNFTFDGFELERVRVYKLVNNIIDETKEVPTSEKYFELIILQNYYGIYIVLVYSCLIAVIVFGYASLKTKYIDKSKQPIIPLEGAAAVTSDKKGSPSAAPVAQPDVYLAENSKNQRLGFLYFFPLFGFLFGPTSLHVTSYTRAAALLIIIATHFSFSSLFVYSIPLDMSKQSSRYYVAFMTIGSTSLLSYWTVGLQHLILVVMSQKDSTGGGKGNNSAQEQAQSAHSKGREAKMRLVSSFNYSFGVAMISLFIIFVSLMKIAMFVGELTPIMLDHWKDVIIIVFVYDVIFDSIIVLILLVTGTESVFASFISLRGFGVPKILDDDDSNQNFIAQRRKV